MSAEGRTDRRGTWVWIAVGCGGLLLSLLCIVPPVVWVIAHDDEPEVADVPAPTPLPTPAPDPLLPPAPSPGVTSPRHIEAVVEESTGLSAVSVGSTCSFDVTRQDRPDGTFWCNAQVRCAGQLLYGGPSAGFFDCTLYEQPERHVVGEDPNTTSTDRDAAMRLDTLSSVLTVRDDASGQLGAFSLRARVTSVR
jgi:hypothetical protein